MCNLWSLLFPVLDHFPKRDHFFFHPETIIVILTYKLFSVSGSPVSLHLKFLSAFPFRVLKEEYKYLFMLPSVVSRENLIRKKAATLKFFLSIFGTQCYLSFSTTSWLNSLHYVLLTMSVTSVCHHATLLQYHQLYSLVLCL